jgi:DME family drug/metabolite transporter
VSSSRSVVLVVAASVLFGTTGTAVALGPDDLTPLQAGAARLIVGGAALMVWVAVQGNLGTAVRLIRRPAGLALIAGICAYQPAFFLAADRTGVAVGALVALGSAPLWTGALAAAVDGFRPGRVWIGATAGALVGLVLLTAIGAEGDAVGVAAAATAGAAYGTYTVAASRLVRDGYPATTVMGAGFGAAGLMALPLLVVVGAGAIATPGGAAVAIWLGLATTAVAYVWFGRGLRRLPAPTVATLTLVEPVVAAALAVIVLGEAASGPQVLGALVLLAAVTVLGRNATAEPLSGARER